MKEVKITFRDDVYEALDKEAKHQGKTLDELVDVIIRDWLVGKGNLRIY